MPSNAARIRTLHAQGVPRVKIAKQVGVTPERVRQVTSRRTPAEIEQLRAQVSARAAELREQGVWPYTP
ncbi:MAG: helix-turn-helix domain-containing protein [Leucobacter sp.]